jgi:hypothetical protein
MGPVKIECECGQNYAFDVEPINGRMPGGVACPGCGADGTVAANEFIAQHLAPAEAAQNPEPIRVATTASAAGSTRQGTMDREKAEQEAKAKIMWGDSMEEVAAYLTVKGLNRSEAAEIAYKVSRERTAIVRRNGIWKIIAGILMMCVPLLGYIYFETAGRIRIKRAIWCYGIGVLGAYFFVTGILAVAFPKTEKGAVDKE